MWSVACRCLEWTGWISACTWRIRLVHETAWAGDIIACTSFTAAPVGNTSRWSDAKSAPKERTETNMVTTTTHTHSRKTTHKNTQETGKIEDKDSAIANARIQTERKRCQWILLKFKENKYIVIYITAVILNY